MLRVILPADKIVLRVPDSACVISGTKRRAQRGQPMNFGDLHLDAGVLSLAFRRRAKSQDGLVAKCAPDFRGDIPQVVKVVYLEEAAAGILRDIIQQCRAVQFLESPAA